MTDAYIFDCVRTPRGKGKADGKLHEVTPLNLSAQTLVALRERNHLDTHLVEDVILGHPAVAECAVVGAPDPKWVEAVTAFVKLEPGRSLSEAEVVELVRAKLAPHKAPKAVHFVADIPKSAVGKILRRELRDKK